MEYTLENLERAVVQFYQSDSTFQQQTHQWLTRAQTSPEAWSFVWELLHPTKPPEVQFFAATTLHTKVVKCWREVPVEQYESLRKRLLEQVLTYSLGPKMVLNRLCITLSAYILQTCPQHWPDAITDLLSAFQPSQLPSIPAERTTWILLEVLTVLPEEFQSAHLSQNQKRLVRGELHKNIPRVLALLESVLAPNATPPLSEPGAELAQRAAACCGAWFQLGVPLADCGRICELLVACALATVDPHPGTCEAALEALATMATHPDNHNHPRLCLELIGKLLPLHEPVRHAADPELVATGYKLFITFAESQSRLLLNALLRQDDTDTRSSVMQLVNVVLECSDSPGVYPVEETTSELALGFWYILQDDVVASEPEQFSQLVAVLTPVYEALTEVMLRKAMLPADDSSWGSDDRELLRCYRQDVADTMMYCHNLLRQRLLELLQARLQSSLELCSRDWRPLESVLHAFTAVAECVGPEENVHLPRLMGALGTLPYAQLDRRVGAAAFDIIGAYAEWINAHPSSLAHAVPLLLMGLGSPDTAPSATMALKDLTRDCQRRLGPFAEHILSASLEALRGDCLRLGESVRLMYTVGRVLAVLPLDLIMGYLNGLLGPYMEELEMALSQQPSATTKARILARLKMISMLFASLDTRRVAEGDEEGCTAASSCGDTVQPVYLVLERVLPVLGGVVEGWSGDPHIIQALCSALKHALATLLEDSCPLVPDMTRLLVRSYRLRPHAPALDLARQFMLLFGHDAKLSPLMQSLLCELCDVTLSLAATSTNAALSEHTDVLEEFFTLLSHVLKKSPQLLVTSSANISALFHLACATISLPEAPAVKAAASFFVCLMTVSREVPALLTVMQTCGPELVQRVLRAISGDSPRSALDPMADILLTLNKKHCDNFHRWLHEAAQSEPLASRADSQQRETFVRAVLKERANKRRLQETVREFSLICRGLHGTEYGLSFPHMY